MDKIYIDEQEALKRVGGNKKLYVKLLKRFAEDTSFQKLKDCTAQGDTQGAQQAAHAIKGMAANLSLKAAYEEATKADAMLKNSDLDQDTLQSFDDAIVQTNAAIEKYVAENE